MRNIAIYVIHVLVVAATAYLGSLSGIFSWWAICLVLLPLVLAITTRLSQFSYTLNVRILFPISVGLFFVALYRFFPEMMAEPELAEGTIMTLDRLGIGNASNVGDSFFEVNDLFKDAVTVLYAICVAFLLLKGLSDFDELKQVLYSEANEIRTISDFTTYFMTSGFPEENRDTVYTLRSHLSRYLENMLVGTKVVTNVQNEQVLQDCLISVGRLKAFDENDQIALGEIMRGLSNISSLRAKRTVCIEKRMSPFILVLVLLMSLTIVLSFFGSASTQVSIDYVYIFLLPTFYTSIFMTLIDLSSPFDGYWQIKLNAIKDVKRKLLQQMAEMDGGDRPKIAAQ